MEATHAQFHAENRRRRAANRRGEVRRISRKLAEYQWRDEANRNRIRYLNECLVSIEARRGWSAAFTALATFLIGYVIGNMV